MLSDPRRPRPVIGPEDQPGLHADLLLAGQRLFLRPPSPPRVHHLGLAAGQAAGRVVRRRPVRLLLGPAGLRLRHSPACSPVHPYVRDSAKLAVVVLPAVILAVWLSG